MKVPLIGEAVGISIFTPPKLRASHSSLGRAGQVNSSLSRMPVRAVPFGVVGCAEERKSGGQIFLQGGDSEDGRWRIDHHEADSKAASRRFVLKRPALGLFYFVTRHCHLNHRETIVFGTLAWGVDQFVEAML